MVLPTPPAKIPLCHSSLPNLTGMPVICTANSNSLKQKLNLHLRELTKIILGTQKLVTHWYARLVEGTQHSESLSKAYLDTVKIPNSPVKIDAVVQKKNKHNSKFHGKHNGSKNRSQSKGGGNCHNCGTLQSIVQLMEKFVTIVIKGDTSSLFVEAVSVASLVQDGREVEVDPGRTNMKFHSMIKLMIAVGTHTSRTLFRLCTIKVFVEISLTFVLTR